MSPCIWCPSQLGKCCTSLKLPYSSLRSWGTSKDQAPSAPRGLEASPSGGSHKNWDARCVVQTLHSSWSWWLTISSQMPIVWHAVDDEVHGKGGSAISTSFNVGICLVTWCVGVSSFVKFIKSMGGGLCAYSDTPSNIPCPDVLEHLESGFLKKTFCPASAIFVQLVHIYWLCGRYCAKCCGGNRNEPDMAKDLKKLSVAGQTHFLKKVDCIKVTRKKTLKVTEKNRSLVLS